MTFADLLRMHQWRLGVTQKELAALIGFGARIVSSWMNGKEPSEVIRLGVKVKLEATPTPHDE